MLFRSRHRATVVDIGAEQHRIGLRSLSLDGLHPGPAGHADVADLAHRALAADGFCPAPTRGRDGPAARPLPVGRLAADLRHLGWLARRGRTGAGRAPVAGFAEDTGAGDTGAGGAAGAGAPTGRTPPARSRPSSP